MKLIEKHMRHFMRDTEKSEKANDPRSEKYTILNFKIHFLETAD